MPSFATNATLTVAQSLGGTETGLIGPMGAVIPLVGAPVTFSGDNNLFVAGAIMGTGIAVQSGAMPTQLQLNITQTGSVVGSSHAVYAHVISNSFIANAGTISANGNALDLGVANADPTVNHVIDNAGVIQSSGDAAIAAAVNGATASSIVNSGAISGRYNAIEVESSTLTSRMELVNSGTIMGTDMAYQSTGVSDHVINAGQMVGDVDLGAGDDVYDGRNGTVTGQILGGGGDDLYIVGKAETQLVEEYDSGQDTVEAYAAHALGTAFETLVLKGAGNLRGYGNDDANDITGNSGDNRLGGGLGNDTLSGADGNDAIFGGGGEDSLVGGNGDDWLSSGAGSDTLNGDDGDDQLFGRRGSDQLNGGEGADWLDGGNSNDTLLGGREDDTLIGGEGSDQLNGGGGADTFVWTRVADSPNSARDVINGYEASYDILDFTALSISEINLGSGFSGNAPAIRTFETSDGDTRVYVDLDGNGSNDMRIDVIDVTGLTALDFLL